MLVAGLATAAAFHLSDDEEEDVADLSLSSASQPASPLNASMRSRTSPSPPRQRSPVPVLGAVPQETREIGVQVSARLTQAQERPATATVVQQQQQKLASRSSAQQQQPPPKGAVGLVPRRVRPSTAPGRRVWADDAPKKKSEQTPERASPERIRAQVPPIRLPTVTLTTPASPPRTTPTRALPASAMNASPLLRSTVVHADENAPTSSATFAALVRALQDSVDAWPDPLWQRQARSSIDEVVDELVKQVQLEIPSPAKAQRGRPTSATPHSLRNVHRPQTASTLGRRDVENHGSTMTASLLKRYFLHSHM